MFRLPFFLCHDISTSFSHAIGFEYLADFLLALTHTDRYWLPDFLPHCNIALRFLPQIAYEKAAQLVVKPEPKSVVRVFMLWKGIKAQEMEYWKEASGRGAEMNCSEWRDIVGVPANVDIGRQRSEGDGMTVLEWGGMEVKG
jgi:hypothetical protein